jgi:hypothetical protein
MNRKCNYCKKLVEIIFFKQKEDGKYNKICTPCSESKKCVHGKGKDRCGVCKMGFCEHGKQKSQCRDCGGSAFCLHDKRKRFCKECNPTVFCIHEKFRYLCKDCGGIAFCVHGKRKRFCKDCGGSAICEHGKLKYNCKDCGGPAICEHGKRKRFCKDCGGSAICEHGKRKEYCRECEGSSFCTEHKKIKYLCKECGGNGLCVHNIPKFRCKECGGNGICPHNREKTKCKECGGSSICIHNTERCRCRLCKGSGLCAHNVRRSHCKVCDVCGHLAKTVRTRVNFILSSNLKEKRTIEYLGCSIEFYAKYLEKLFKPGMTWENHSLHGWHIDHIIPLKYDDGTEITLDKTIERLHYTNTQPLWSHENLSKGNRYISEVETFPECCSNIEKITTWMESIKKPVSKHLKQFCRNNNISGYSGKNISELKKLIKSSIKDDEFYIIM